MPVGKTTKNIRRIDPLTGQVFSRKLRELKLTFFGGLYVYKFTFALCATVRI